MRGSLSPRMPSMNANRDFTSRDFKQHFASCGRQDVRRCANISRWGGTRLSGARAHPSKSALPLARLRSVVVHAVDNGSTNGGPAASSSYPQLPPVSLNLDLGEFQAEWDAVREAQAALPPAPRSHGTFPPAAGAEQQSRETAYLVGTDLKGPTKQKLARSSTAAFGMEESLRELAQLADTAGLRVVGSTSQRVEAANSRTFIGSGKVQEIAAFVAANDVDTVIFDDELTPTQGRNLERLLGEGVNVCDRTNLILDIFSQRARTAEGKLQVELAVAEYQLPRLTRMWSHLERQAGGGQVKGMGEKQIEVDKRLLRDQISRLRENLEAVRLHRSQYRVRRAKVPLPVAAIVGYTNAGKSTMLNRLTGKNDVFAEDKLFATLDPTTRNIQLPSGKELLVTDTVGFIQKLPTQLVAAFRATLEEVAEASVLLHVVDASSPRAVAESEAVRQVLCQLQVAHIPVVTVWNKLDLAPNPDILQQVAGSRSDTFCVSAHTGEGMDALLVGIEDMLQNMMQDIKVLVPYTQGQLLGELHQVGVVAAEHFTEEGTWVQAHVPAALASRIQKMADSDPTLRIQDPLE